MIGLIAAAFGTLAIFTYFIIWPVLEYYKDPKGLRRFPNFHALSGITDLVFIGEAHRGFRSDALLKAHKKYPVLRIGPNSLSYGDTRAIKDIYGHNTRCIKDRFYEALAGSHFHLADVVDKPEHARKRKVLSAAFAIKNLENWEHKVADMTGRLMAGAERHCTSPLETNRRPIVEDLNFDYRMWSNLYTIDAIANIALSEKLGFLDQGSDLVWGETMDGTRHQINYRECLHSTAKAQSNLVWAYDWYKTFVELSKIISPGYRRLWKNSEGWNDIVHARVMNRLRRYQAGEKLDDFFAVLMDDKNGNPNNLEFGEIAAEISIMMNAGSDTTAIAMNNTMFMLLRNPRCLNLLRQELNDTLDADEYIAPYDKIKHLPYLRACIDEAMRIYPPTTFALPRRTPADGAPILGDFIPGNTSVSMSAWVAHRDENIFPEPEIFRPERWLEEGGKELQSYFITFSTGARGCIGRNISYLEQMVALASLLHNYEFALPHPEWEPAERRENFNLSPSAMPLKVWKRTKEYSLAEKQIVV